MSYFSNFFQADHSKGWQTNGDSRCRRSGLSAAQVRVLHEGHRQDVPLPVAGEDHSVPG